MKENPKIVAVAVATALSFCAPAALAQSNTSGTNQDGAQVDSGQTMNTARDSNMQVAQACLDNLSRFGQQMRDDGYWLSGWGSRWGYGVPPAAGAADAPATQTQTQQAAGTTAGTAAQPPMAATGPWTGPRWGMQSPRHEIRTLHNAAIVLGHRGDQQGCEATLAALREVYDGYVGDLNAAGVEPGNVTTWRQERIALAKPVSEIVTGGINVADIIDTEVRNAKDVGLGSISDVVIDRKSGKINYVVVSRGGFLGIGDDYVAVPWEALKATPGFNTVVLDVSEQTMDQAPKVDPDQFVDLTRDSANRQQINSYWQDHSQG